MAVSNVTPAADSTLNYADSFSFEVTAGYTSLLVRVTTMGGVVEAAYDSSDGGEASGYTVSVTDLGATHQVTVARDAGWSIDPTQVYVTEDLTNLTQWTYDVFPTASYPEGMQPYNDIGSAGQGVTSFEGRQGAVVATAGDYLASEVTNDSGVAGANVDDALDTLAASIPGAAPVTSVFGRAGVVVQAAGDYLASQVTNDSSVAGTNVDDALNNLENDLAATDIEVATKKDLELSGAGAPGVSTADNEPLGLIYVDTTGDLAYVLVDNTPGANVWSSGVTDHGALGGLADDDHTQYARTDGTRNQVEVLLDEETTATGTPSSTQAIFWADDHANGQRLRWSRGRYPADFVIPFASSFSNTGLVYWSGVTGQQASSSLFTYTSASGRLWMNQAGASLVIKEGASPSVAPAAGNGQFWVRNDIPNVPMFTDDALAANQLAYLSALNDGTVDHGSTGGLGDDDHSQYALDNNDGTQYDVPVYTAARTIGQAAAGQLRFNDGRFTATGTDPALFLGERAAAPTHAAGYGALWVLSGTNELWFTTDTGADAEVPTIDTAHAATTDMLVRWDGNNQITGAPDLEYGDGGQLKLNSIDATLRMQENAGGYGGTPGYGIYYVKNDTPNRAAFIDDAGTDHVLEYTGHTHVEADITDLDHTDVDAIHDNVAGEIAALTLVTAAAGDHILIEDASDTNNKKRVAASDFLAGTGDVVGPASATDNGIARYNTTTGKLIQDSTCRVDDNGNLIQDTAGAFLQQTETGSPPSTSAGKGRWWTMNTAPTSPWFTDDTGLDRRLDLMPVTLTGRFSFASNGTWYGPTRSGGYYNDVDYTNTFGTGTTPATSTAYLVPPLIIFPEDADVQLVHATVSYNATGLVSGQFEVGTIDMATGDTAAGTYDTLIDGPSNTFAVASTTKNYIQELTIGDSTMLPAASHHQGVHFFSKMTTATTGELMFTLTLWFRTYSTTGWDL